MFNFSYKNKVVGLNKIIEIKIYLNKLSGLIIFIVRNINNKIKIVDKK
jgi:hypothetical protein